MAYSSWLLTDFVLKDDAQLELGGKLGLLKVMRSDDGLLVLVVDDEHGLIDQTAPTPAGFANPDSLLGFILDIGIRRERRLTYGNGFYFGGDPLSAQSKRPISAEVDLDLLEKLSSRINDLFQSADKDEEGAGIRLQELFGIYNAARLLFPNFVSESYLNLMRIMDALSPYERAEGVATFAATISPDRNRRIYEKVRAVGGYKDRIDLAPQIHRAALERSAKSKKPWLCATDLSALDDAGMFVFACFYAAYRYRNTFVHHGFPFPSIVRDAIGANEDLGTAYLHPAVGMSWFKTHRPSGLEQGDAVDVHDVLGTDATDFRNQYFQLLPTWHFLKEVAREALLKEALS